ncbi:flagellar hook-associated protein FlgK [Devosia sp.]|uniref:flagellar hook-associated protein FlgK n=1 Tax=Devosia sp. TaxID=1871048 RepID=UPI003A8D4C46
MGLSVTLSNALSGLRVGQSSMEVLSRNVSNAGTPGYHKQSVSVIDTLGINSAYAREGTITRAFNESLQKHYTSAISGSGFADVRSTYLDRLQTLMGKPGTTGSLDTAYAGFQNSLVTLATTPDSFASRAETVQQAQILAETLNRMSGDIQSMRGEIEGKIATTVNDLNSMLGALEDINTRMPDGGIDAGSRAAMLDQRDRLLNDLSNALDIRVTYRPDDTVSIMTRSGVGLLDNRASVFAFQSAGALDATSLANVDPEQNGVGTLTLETPSGLTLDLVGQNVFRSGELAGLIQLRDGDLVDTQAQLDEVAAALAQAMSTEITPGTDVTVGASAGYEVDIGALRNGNDFTFSYLENGIEKNVRAVRVDDTAKLPMDYKDANGVRVIGLNFSGGTASVATQLQDAMGSSIAVSNPSGTTLRLVDDGPTGTIDMLSLNARATVTGAQTGAKGLSLFVDTFNADFTNSLDNAGQKLGFASRIRVNPAIINDTKLLVQYDPTSSLGDATRVDQLVSNLDNLRFAGGAGSSDRNAVFRIAGTVSDLVSQTINYVGNMASTALADSTTQALTMTALSERLDAEYGVDIDEEMARLIELQNAYSANARVVSTVQELIDALLRI